MVMVFFHVFGSSVEHPAAWEASSITQDCFILAAKEASSVTLVARSPAWILPQRFLGIPLESLPKVVSWGWVWPFLTPWLAWSNVQGRSTMGESMAVLVSWGIPGIPDAQPFLCNFRDVMSQTSIGIPNAKKPEEYLASTRWFANLVFPPYHDASFLRRFLGDLFWPFQTLLWWILSPILWVHFWLPWSMLPKFSLRWQLWHGHSVSICNAQKVKACGPMNGR